MVKNGLLLCETIVGFTEATVRWLNLVPITGAADIHN